MVLGVFTSNASEAMRRSAALAKAGIEHKLFGTQVAYFSDNPPGHGPDAPFFQVICLDEIGEASMDFTDKLREQGITEVVNAGTLNSMLYSLGAERDFYFSKLMRTALPSRTFPKRTEVLILEDSLVLARIGRRSLHDFLNDVGPEPGFYEPAGNGRCTEEQILAAVAETRAHLAAFTAREAGGRRPELGRVALTVVHEGGCGIPEVSTDLCLVRPAEGHPTGQLRLLMKVSHAGQSPLDPPAIGPRTILEARNCGFDGIVITCDGLIFDRPSTLELARLYRMPIYGC